MGLWQQDHLTVTKHVHRVLNLANEDVDLVGTFDKAWSFFHASLTVTTFKFV